MNYDIIYNVKIKCDIGENANDGCFPERHGDWIDLFTAEEVSMKPFDFKLISLGVAMKLPEGYEAIVVPRSSTYKKWGVIQANSCGVIDNAYCGDNDIWMFPAIALRETVIPKYTRICQFKIVQNQPNIQFSFVNKLDYEDRGGFGSTDSE